MLLEVIAGSVEDAIAAERGGATRIELCVDLDQDGLTPPLCLVQAVTSAIRIPTRVMLRPRNDFLAKSDAEISALCDTAQAIAQCGAAGMVLGFIEDACINERAVHAIASAAPTLKITFHRAFDALDDPFDAIQRLKRFAQVDCILTAGGSGNWAQRAQRLIQLRQCAAPEVTILAGGGVDADAIEWLCRHTPLRAFHAGRAAREHNAVNGRVIEESVRTLSLALNKSRAI